MIKKIAHPLNGIGLYLAYTPNFSVYEKGKFFPNAVFTKGSDKPNIYVRLLHYGKLGVDGRVAASKISVQLWWAANKFENLRGEVQSFDESL